MSELPVQMSVNDLHALMQRSARLIIGLYRSPVAAAVFALWTAYAILFVMEGVPTIVAVLCAATANVMVLAMLTCVVWEPVCKHLTGEVNPKTVVLHLGAAIGYSVAWYALVLVALAFVRGLRGRGFTVDNFSAIAFGWQFLQGLAVYAAVAAVARASAMRIGTPTRDLAVNPRWMRRFLTRVGDEIRPIDVAQIITVKGAQDYAEVATTSGLHLIRLSLAELEAKLDPEHFIRVHRSTIIAFDHFERAEPAGSGRLTAFMTNGDAVAVSRAGAQSLRRFLH